MEKVEKKVVFSGVQPSGNLTLGNYLGAMKQFASLQDDYETYFCVVDQHSITVPQVAAELRKKSKELLALYIAMGIDPEKSCLFVQSHVPGHAQLSWVLSTITYMGQLSRMTQYKDKVKNNPDNQNVGLFTYPVLMAADILLYQADLVPVGIDQKQHLELCRDLAIRFNNRYSDTFKIPDGLITKESARIMSLKNPEYKMSKSDPDQNATIYILDDKDAIIRKIKRAVTDSLGEFNYSDEQMGLKNLINIAASVSGKSIDEILKEYQGENYSRFKEELGESIYANLAPIQERFKEIVTDKEYLAKVLKNNTERASYKANKTLRKVYKKVGFIEL